MLTSRTVDRRTGARVYFKCENLQRGGAFKFRGAYNALHRLASDEKRRGVVAYSSGNHAQAVALAGQLLGVPATIVMPDDAPQVKIDATRGYGAEVVLYDRSRDDREAIANELARTRGVDSRSLRSIIRTSLRVKARRRRNSWKRSGRSICCSCPAAAAACCQAPRSRRATCAPACA